MPILKRKGENPTLGMHRYSEFNHLGTWKLSVTLYLEKQNKCLKAWQSRLQHECAKRPCPAYLCLPFAFAWTLGTILNLPVSCCCSNRRWQFRTERNKNQNSGKVDISQIADNNIAQTHRLLHVLLKRMSAMTSIFHTLFTVHRCDLYSSFWRRSDF